MELITEPDYYDAAIDKNGNYVDFIPQIRNEIGIRCLCGSRKDKIYNSSDGFKSHINSQHHKKWLEYLNNNKQNFYKENREMREIITTQKQIIAKMEKEIIGKNSIIEHLNSKIIKPICIETPDLLDFS